MAEATGSLHIDIISPEKPLFSGDGMSIVAPGHDGEVGILPKHAPMVMQLGVGEVRIKRGTRTGVVTDYYAVKNGFLETSGNKVIIVTEEAKSQADCEPGEISEKLSEARSQVDSADDADAKAEAQLSLKWFQTLDRLKDRASS